MDFGLLATCLQWLSPAINTLKLSTSLEEGKKNSHDFILGAFKVEWKCKIWVSSTKDGNSMAGSMNGLSFKPSPSDQMSVNRNRNYEIQLFTWQHCHKVNTFFLHILCPPPPSPHPLLLLLLLISSPFFISSLEISIVCESSRNKISPSASTFPKILFFSFFPHSSTRYFSYSVVPILILVLFFSLFFLDSCSKASLWFCHSILKCVHTVLLYYLLIYLL